MCAVRLRSVLGGCCSGWGFKGMLVVSSRLICFVFLVVFFLFWRLNVLLLTNSQSTRNFGDKHSECYRYRRCYLIGFVIVDYGLSNRNGPHLNTHRDTHWALTVGGERHNSFSQPPVISILRIPRTTAGRVLMHGPASTLCIVCVHGRQGHQPVLRPRHNQFHPTTPHARRRSEEECQSRSISPPSALGRSLTPRKMWIVMNNNHERSAEDEICDLAPGPRVMVP